mgnify:CR=1 FL=1
MFKLTEKLAVEIFLVKKSRCAKEIKKKCSKKLLSNERRLNEFFFREIIKRVT